MFSNSSSNITTSLSLLTMLVILKFPILWDSFWGRVIEPLTKTKALAVIQAISMSYKKENEGKSKNFPSTRLLYNSVTDYLTFKSDFFKLVEFTEWLKENYPERIISHKR